jgi:hypothetical protein
MRGPCRGEGRSATRMRVVGGVSSPKRGEDGGGSLNSGGDFQRRHGREARGKRWGACDTLEKRREGEKREAAVGS